VGIETGPEHDATTLEVVVADSAGACFGVLNAIEIAREHRQPILGPLVHNPEVVQGLAAQGIPILERYSEVDPAATPGLVITAHGYPRDRKDELAAQGVEVHDATCPVLLRGVYRHIERLNAEGFHIFLVGDPRHAEIIASQSYGTRISVVYTEDEARVVPEGLGQTVAMCQTTLTRGHFDTIVSVLQEKYPDLRVMDTRCRPVKNQQEAVEELAQWVDGFIVLGGLDSSNTRNLARIAARRLGERVHHIDRPEKLTAEMLEGMRRVGVGGGTSTPRDQIDALLERISEVFPGEVRVRADRDRGGDHAILPVDEDGA
jgi:4-hydroxy-3-methylbut-2-enyl diphosphate reductase